MIDPTTIRRGFRAVALLSACTVPLAAQGEVESEVPRPSFEELKQQGARRSSFLQRAEVSAADGPAEADLETFRREIQPILSRACYECHGPEEDEGGVRIDTLDPDLFEGEDVDWWLDALAALTNGEMPPEDGPALADEDRSKVVLWLSVETQRASAARREGGEHSSFRRMTRYEYDHALQDLLGLPYDFASDLPPDPASEDGFRNTSETLHLTASQLRSYLDANRRALELAVVTGEQPAPLYWGVPMQALAEPEWKKQEQQLAKIREKHAEDPEKAAAEVEKQRAKFQKPSGGVYFVDPETGQKARQPWGYGGAKFARKPSDAAPAMAEAFGQHAVVTPRNSLIVELGDRVPERGMLRVRFRAERQRSEGRAPRMQLIFGWQASNDSRSLMTVSDEDVVIAALPGAAEVYEFQVPLSQIYPRNLVKGVNKLGDLPSPSEFVRLAHAGKGGGPVRIDHVEVTAPFYAVWPPASHTRILAQRKEGEGDPAYARRVLRSFMERAWRRPVSGAELRRKLALLAEVRPACDSFEQAVVEVLATVLTSPHFLFLSAESGGGADEPVDALQLTDHELATRLSIFLWSSIPDDELRALADAGRLRDPEVLGSQIERMLADPRAARFAEHFVHQWLDLELLEFLQIDRKLHPGFDAALKAAMLDEPVAFFRELLDHDRSVLDFLHADYAMVNERLAKHYGWEGVVGDEFRRVDLGPDAQRGGLLTQAGLLAMNSDGEDSHPLKRGIWLLERLLDDPPPPPPPAVPEIDLADPRIAEMTLKERLLDHRNHAACYSCHAKIDPWGFAFENYDAVGAWRSELRGEPVDSMGVLFNGQKLDGMEGLKRFLLENRQDQFVRAMVKKLTTYALGRPLVFGDRAAVDEIASRARRNGDGLATLVTAIATSELFRSR